VAAHYTVEDEAEATIRIPKSIHDINNCSILGYGGDLAEGHPGYHDAEYKRRRTAISDIARDHRVYVSLLLSKTPAYRKPGVGLPLLLVCSFWC
jgi:hypothetical protein